MTTKELYTLAERSAKLEFTHLEANLSFCIEVNKVVYLFALDGLSEPVERVCIAHECGHINYAGLYSERATFDTISRIEYRAQKYAFLKLMPIGAVKEAIKDPFCRNCSDIAEWFGVTEAFATQALEYYKRCASLE